jgi:hypothetical protein
MAPTVMTSKYNAFPKHQVKKKVSEWSSTKAAFKNSENEKPSFPVNNDDLIRLDIKRRF